MRPVPAPSADRNASSCRRTSARTSNRFVTLAQAISITSPMVAITTHSTSLHAADHLLLERAEWPA